MSANGKLENFMKSLRDAGFQSVEKVSLDGVYSPNNFVKTEVNNQAYQNAITAGVQLHRSSNHYQYHDWTFVLL